MAICFTVTLLPVPPVYLDFDASNVKVNRPELVESFFFCQLRRIQSKRSSSDWINPSQPITNCARYVRGAAVIQEFTPVRW